ncbi:hypothetical protein MVEN_02513900 [Mycena venus]|uniref:Uncharacterized protein n=1 Tax=Mycena venus TaxID=2733690 RepID=A0A8H6WUI2_9AGAR|nr:hypothetical protein MVEN_02513900 [Mycena venus]
MSSVTSDSSASESPMLLTPDSTGAGDTEAAASQSAMKKARRQTAFYPNINSSNKPQKPFSRSAAKRESVMALGSIEHLQHYFTKTGIEAKKNSKAGKIHHGLVPVFGGLTHVRTESTESSASVMDLPPSPAIPQPAAPSFPPYVKTFEMDPESLLPGVIDDLADVSFAWRIDQTIAPTHAPSDRLGVAGSGPTDAIDVLNVLKTTTRAIRSVRNYLLSLPDESAGTIRAQFRARHLAPSNPSSFRPALSSNLSSSSSFTDLRGAAAAAHAKDKEARADPLTLIRKSALEVLTVLREMEERCRLPLSDDAYDAQSDGGGSRGGHSRMASPSMHSDELSPDEHDHDHDVHGGERDADTSVAFSLVQVQGRYESVPVWEDEDAGWEADDDEKDKAKKEGWDEKLVLGSGWLYQQNVRLEDLEKERRVVGTYLDVVDEVLFEGKKTGEAGREKERGWERERRKAIDKGSLRSRSRVNRRGSSVDREGPGPTVLTPSTTGDKTKRRVSVGMFDMMSAFKITEEPGQIDEIDEEGAESEGSIDDEELPEWARRKAFDGNELGRTHALLSAFLPAPLLPALVPSSQGRGPFLECLSSGQLLCVAYNSCVRKSKKPWGYISKDGIHDILALEQAARDDGGGGGDEAGKAEGKAQKGWTFRRVDNLRLWAGALKIRYLLPIVAPPQAGTATPNSNTPLNSPAPATAPQRFNPEQPPVVFDAKAVARKDAGWEDILENAMLRWVRCVVAERRGET